MPKVKRIRVEIYTNQDVRDYHVTTQVSSEEVRGGLFGGSRLEPFKQMSFGEGTKELTEDTKSTVMRFYDIDGIDSVGLSTNKIRIDRSPAYEWEEIEDEIIAAIKVTAGWVEDEVQVDYLFAGRHYSEPVPTDFIERELDRRRAESEKYDRMFGGF